MIYVDPTKMKCPWGLFSWLGFIHDCIGAQARDSNPEIQLLQLLGGARKIDLF